MLHSGLNTGYIMLFCPFRIKYRILAEKYVPDRNKTKSYKIRFKSKNKKIFSLSSYSKLLLLTLTLPPPLRFHVATTLSHPDAFCTNLVHINFFSTFSYFLIVYLCLLPNWRESHFQTINFKFILLFWLLFLVLVLGFSAKNIYIYIYIIN